MTSSGAAVTTETPTLVIVADLGDSPPLPSVRKYIAVLDEVRIFADALAAVADRQDLPTATVEKLIPLARNPARRGTLHVARMRLESPFEVVLTTVAAQYSPVAYALVAIAIVERSVRLVMDWQKHRAELQEMRTGIADVGPSDPERRRAAQEIAQQIIREAYLAAGRTLSGEELRTAVDAATPAIDDLARVQVTEVASTGIGRS